MSLAQRVFTVSEVYRMVEAGILGRGERLELIEGQLVPMSPQNPPHSTAVMLATDTLHDAFRATHFVRVQLPFAISAISEPEPDFAIVARDRYQPGPHPDQADLIVEVADSSLAYDRHEKGSMYARQGVPEYWIVNLTAGCLEVYQDPVPDPEAPFGYRYQTLEVFGPTASVRASHLMGPAIPVAGLLP